MIENVHVVYGRYLTVGKGYACAPCRDTQTNAVTTAKTRTRKECVRSDICECQWCVSVVCVCVLPCIIMQMDMLVFSNHVNKSMFRMSMSCVYS